eukprot:GHVO01047796.1.p1 GENE.GHVO01047796.1~~GHVO01047796.1.p1  ORF type:complete len:260 (+),score=18.02 GHVO01047796.1:82-780(+)
MANSSRTEDLKAAFKELVNEIKHSARALPYCCFLRFDDFRYVLEKKELSPTFRTDFLNFLGPEANCNDADCKHLYIRNCVLPCDPKTQEEENLQKEILKFGVIQSPLDHGAFIKFNSPERPVHFEARALDCSKYCEGILVEPTAAILYDAKEKQYVTVTVARKPTQYRFFNFKGQYVEVFTRDKLKALEFETYTVEAVNNSSCMGRKWRYMTLAVFYNISKIPESNVQASGE